MKKAIVVLLCSSVLLFSCEKEKTSTPPATTDELFAPFNGKIVHYLFNNSLRDTSGNGNHGGEASGLSYAADRFNRASRAISFDGINSKFEGKGMRMAFPFAISFWMKTPTPSAAATLIKSEKNPGDPGLYTGFWFQTLPGGPYTLAFNFGDGTGYNANSRNSLLSTISMSANQWHHIVVNVTGANNMEIYIDGVKDNNAVYDGIATSMFYTFTNPSATIGYGFTGQFFNGNMDDLRLYNRVLTTTEITTLYNFTP